MTANRAWLTHQWVVAGIISAASRFVPIPFVDDMIRDRCRRYVVSQTLASYDKSAWLDDFKALYGNDRGFIAGALSSVAKIPIKLLLFPVRKVVAIATSVRGVPLEIMRTVLLGRTLERYLLEDQLVGNSDQIAQMQSAFEVAFRRMDFRIVKAAIADALESVGGWKNAAIKSAKSMVESNDTPDITLREEPKIALGAGEVQAVLDRPETLQLFAEFDRRFDEAMAGKF